MQIRSSSGNGYILESVINKTIAKNNIVMMAKVAYHLEGIEGAKAVIEAGIIDSMSSGIEFEDNDISFVVANISNCSKMQKKAWGIGDVARGVGKVLSLPGKALKGLINAPENLQNWGYGEQKKEYEVQLGNIKNLQTTLSKQYDRLQQFIQNYGSAANGIQAALQEGKIDPQATNAAQGAIKAMISILNSMNNNVSTIMKVKMPVAPEQAQQQGKTAPATATPTPAPAPAVPAAAAPSPLE